MSEFGIIAIAALVVGFFGGLKAAEFWAGFIERNLPMEEAAEEQRRGFRRAKARHQINN